MRRGLLALVIGVAGLVAQAAALQVAPLQKAVALIAAPLYLSPDATSAQVGSVQPGTDVGIQDSSGDFVEVFNGVSGWMRNHGLARLDDPDSPEVIFGAAAELESAAEDSGGERQAAQAAAQLYAALYADFPTWPRADEAMYRAADIRWQVQMGEAPKRRTPTERLFPDDSGLRKVIGKFPDSPWAARAAYALLVEHFTCGDWNEKPECLGKEANTYLDYAKKYPRGPMTAEADYDAVYREAIGWTLYNASGAQHDASKADEYKREVARDADAMRAAFPDNDWTARAALVAFNVRQGAALTVPGVTPLGGP